MPLVLRSDLRIVKDKDSVYLNKINDPGFKIYIHPMTATTLALFNGRRGINEIEQIMVRGFGLSKLRARARLNKITAQFNTFLLEEREALVDGIKSPNTRLNPKDFIFKMDRNCATGRDPMPSELCWYVTKYCCRRCRYCSERTIFGNRAEDSTLSLDEVMSIIDQAKEIGVKLWLLTGGEPFLRSDLPEIIHSITSHGMKCGVVTKYPLKRDQIKKLKHSSIQIDISFDSHLEPVADFLTGTRGFYDETIRTMRYLKEEEIPFYVMSVLTKKNYLQIEDYAEFVYGLGARGLRFQKCDASLYRNIQDLILDNDELERAKKQIEKVDQTTGDSDFEIGYEDVESKKEKKHYNTKLSNWQMIPTYGCTVGRKKLTFRYDGRACLCERIPEDENFIFGDLKSQSIMEVWNSNELRKFIFPPRSLFKSNGCFACALFDRCVVKTACVAQSKELYGDYYTPVPKVIENCPYCSLPTGLGEKK